MLEKRVSLLPLLEGHPSLAIGPLLEMHQHENDSVCAIPVGDILRESLAHENKALKVYYQLLELVQGKSVMLEEYARTLIELKRRCMPIQLEMLRQPVK